MASAATAHSTQLWPNTAARSPFSSPRARSMSAMSRICAAKSPHVTARHPPSGVGTMKRGRDARSSSASKTARGAIFSSWNLEASTSLVLLGPALDLLLEVHQAALQFVQRKKSAVLVALRGQPERAPPDAHQLVVRPLHAHRL